MLMFGILLAVIIIWVTTADPETIKLHALSQKMKRVHAFIRANKLPHRISNQLEVGWRCFANR